MKQTFCLARATLLLLVMLCSIGVWADDYPFTYTFNEVTTGYETLNQAITAANENSGGTIKINAEGVYTLSGNINADLEIAASGVTLNVGQLTVSGQITVNGVQYDLSIGDDGVLNAQSVSGVQTCTISGGTVNANLLAFQEGTIENATINASIEAGSSTTITGSTIDAEKIVSLNASSDITFTNCNINLSLYLMFFGAVTFDVPYPGISIKVAEYDKMNDGSLTIANGSLTDGANVYTGAIANPSVLNNKTLTYYNEGGDPGTVTVTLNQQGGSGGTTSVTPTSGEAMPAITLPTRTGYTFDGYFTGTNGNGTQYYNADGSSATNWDLTVSTILYAKWTGNTYSVTLNRQGGSGGTESVTATFGSAMPGITPPIRDGYDFGGYYTGSNGEGTKYYTASGTSAWNWDIDQDTELFAKWTVKTYTVTLDRQGGNGGTASVDVAYGSAMPAITPPTMLGYDFCGYFTETNGNGTKYYDADGTSTRTWDIDATTTLYAKWENISIEQDGITYEWTSGTNVKVAGCNGTLTSITIPASVNHNDVLYNVTEIGEEAFMDNISLMSIDLTNCLITVIRARAFKNCTNLSSVLLPASLTTIGDETFPTNANTTVTIADGLYLHNGDEVLSGDVTDMDKLNGKTLQPAIPYIKNGTTAYCTNFTVLDNTMTTLAGGWYVVNSDVTFSGNLSINDSGKVHIILCDGATLTANKIAPNGNRDKLCIYGQSQGTGTANISGNIMGNYSVSIYGGTINVTGNITCAQGSIGIYGGTITAGQLQALNNGAQITLGGATVKANSYSADDGVTILPGITYYDGEGHGYNAGDLSADEIAAIAGKTLTPAIPYIDANGDTAYCTDFTELTSGGAQTLPGGWYVVNSDISRSGMQLFESDTHIILADDATMTITQDGNYLGLISNGSLTIYGQTAGNGALNVTATVAISSDDNIIINGGNITANGTDMGISAINITINGGKVSANGDLYGIKASASGNITLGWTKATDQIYASSYSGTVTIADGKTLYNGTEGLSGTINSDDFASKLNGKRLRTYDYRTVSYVKADGTTGSADAIPLTGGGATMLAGGWYVVNSDIEYTGKITLDGDVNLILMANKEMTVSANSVASAIEGNSTGSLTVYGEGSLSVTATNAQAAIGGITAYTQVSGSVTLNAPIYGIYSVGSVAICGGSMTATTTGSANNRIGISSDDNITITGGTVSATGIDGMNASNDVCITGGQVTSNGRINANNGDITLGWTSATDFITASSFSGTVTIAAGQAFINDASTPEIVSGTDIDKALVDGKTLKPQWTGSGDSESDPYMINRPGELDLLAQRVNDGTSDYNGKYFKLGADIAYSHTTDWDDATSTENNYTAIGGFFNNNGCPFMGTFDGQGHTVSGIRIYRDGNDDVDENLGLFGLVQSGTVKNVTVSDMRITGYALVGGIVGYALVGGIVGYNDIYSSVENCHATATVALNAVQNGAYYFGGIVGYNSNIIGCSSSVTITTSGTLTDCKDFGGIVGSTDDGCSVKNCLAVGVAIPNISFTHIQNDITASGAIAGCFSGDALSHNYYSGCTLGGTLTESGIGAGRDDNGNSNSNERHDVTDNNGAVPTTLHTLTLGEHITASGVLISQGGTISVAEGSTVVLSYSGPLDANKIAVFSLGSTALSGNSFTMPAADATVSVSTVTAWGIDGGADGSEGNPYVITRCAELDLLSQRVNSGTGDDYAASGYSSKTFVLANDIAYAPNGIDANGENYTAIGISSHSFKGIFDGQGHTISGIRIYKGGQTPNVDGNLGLFGYVYNGTVRNVTLADASITGYDNVGGIAGNSSSGTIENCLVIGTSIRATHNINGSGGAIVGNNFSGTTLSHNYYSDCIRNISSSGIGTKNGDYSINDGAVRAIILSETEAVPTTLSGKVVFRRSFIKDVASTVCLPFGIDATQAAAAGKFYTFVGVDKSGEKWEVIMQEADTSVDPPVTGNEATTLDANTPYLFKPAATGPVLFYGTAPASVSAGETSDTEGWTFRGTYEKRQWDDTHNQDEIGRIYGFAAQAATSTAESGSHDIEAGQFIRIAGGPNSYALPFRAYLKYEPAPQSAARRTASELPTSMTVRLIGANGETTEITTLNVEHGTLNDDSWYSLDGRKLNAKPTQKGMYIYKGKKQVIK